MSSLLQYWKQKQQADTEERDQEFAAKLRALEVKSKREKQIQQLKDRAYAQKLYDSERQGQVVPPAIAPKPIKKKLELPFGWEEHFDSESGQNYYYNRFSNHSQWNHPSKEQTGAGFDFNF
jgi:hypothetical protein